MGFRLGGLASGLDTKALIDAVMAVERRPLSLVQQRKADVELEKELFRELNTKLLALREAAAALDNRNTVLSGPAIEEELFSYVATSSDESVLSARASSAATPGAQDVGVNALAGAARHVSEPFSSPSDNLLARRRIEIDYGGAAPIDFRLPAGPRSLELLRDLINTDPDNDGSVRADILFDGSGYRLIVSGTKTGAANDLTVWSNIPAEGGGSFFDSALEVSATDAQLEVLGVPITRDSNTIEDALPGVSLTLRGTSVNPVQVKVDRDDESIAAKFQTFVDAYNDVIDLFLTQARVDVASGEAGPLSGDATLRQVEQQVQRSLVQRFSFADNPFQSLAELGLSLDAEGRLELDGEKLSTALDTDALGVRQMLGGDDVADGAFTALARILDPITESGTGSLAIRDQGFDDRIAGLDRQIERMELRLAQREEFLVRRFSELESTLSTLQGQGNSLLALIQQNGSGG
ncbi:MAG: flagellar filament capping protein FliD [Myxococcota bacterium]